MPKVDPRFQAAKSAAKARRRKTRAWRAGLAVAVVAALAATAWLTRDKWHFRKPGAVTVASGGRTLVAVKESGHDILSAFVNLPGDPLLLHLGASGAEASSSGRGIARPAGLPPTRGAGALELVQDVMISGQQVIATVPSNQEDFAVFQAQRASQQGGPAPGTTPPGGKPAPATAKPQSSTAFVRPADKRHAPTSDVVLRLTSPRPLADVLKENHLTATEAAAVADAAKADLGIGTLATGDVLALRGVAQDFGTLSFRQLSLYRADKSYVGSLARADPPPAADGSPGTGAGPLVQSADPWVQDDLFARTAATPAAAPARQYRVLDAFYSAALRNKLPSSLVGRIIMLLSQANDLDATATPGDRMTILYSPDPGTAPPGLGQVLYVAIKGANVSFNCYVYPPGPGQDYACYGRARDHGPVAAVTPASAPATGSGPTAQSTDVAITQLVDRIITVESGGKADAKNPLSSAFGAGQFIDSTWLRMMRTYRPDLVAKDTKKQLLALRADPAIARQMVINLAKEGEVYLRARGHQITAGRLYLAHFLGMQGANAVLDAKPDAPLVDIVGQPVISANPFLKGQDCAFVISWAAQRMAGATNAAVFREPTGLDQYRALIAALLPSG